MDISSNEFRPTVPAFDSTATGEGEQRHGQLTFSLTSTGSTSTTTATTTSAEKIQTVVFVRHGIAKHNLLGRDGRHPNLQDPDLFDPPLTLAGKRQSLEAGERLRVWWKTTQVGESMELILTSPLTRCLQTTSLALCPGDLYVDGNREPTMACLEALREAHGMSYPDRRRTTSLLKQSWPHIHFDPSMTENDEQWSLTEREHVPDVMRRIQSSLTFVVGRPETNLVCVTHGVWMECLFHAYAPQALRNGDDRVRNCDCFASECVSVNGQFQRLQNVRRIDSAT